MTTIHQAARDALVALKSSTSTSTIEATIARARTLARGRPLVAGHVWVAARDVASPKARAANPLNPPPLPPAKPRPVAPVSPLSRASTGVNSKSVPVRQPATRKEVPAMSPTTFLARHEQADRDERTLGLARVPGMKLADRRARIEATLRDPDAIARHQKLAPTRALAKRLSQPTPPKVGTTTVEHVGGRVHAVREA